jgi:hypothetical protein
LSWELAKRCVNELLALYVLIRILKRLVTNLLLIRMIVGLSNILSFIKN